MEFQVINSELKKSIVLAKKLLLNAEALLITTGAGMGVDSGLPDFRGTDGFWQAYPAISKMNLSFSEIANPRWFHTNPSMAWAFYGHRLNLYRQTIPHRGFEYLLRLAHQMKYGYFVMTSNVDGHFQKAGYDAKKILELHGSIHHLQCSTPCFNRIWSASKLLLEVNLEQLQTISPPGRLA